MVLIKKGAEAWLFREKWYEFDVIRKWRIPKKYRVKELDKAIRVFRTKHEARLLSETRKKGVPTPIVFMVNLMESSIIMEDVKGKVLKEVLDTLPLQEKKRICMLIGENIGKMHKAGIVHGDLTTSNIILTNNNQIVFVDFGLASFSKNLEDHAVDLHLMERTLESTHHKMAKKYFNWIIEGYRKIMKDYTNKVLQQIKEIRLRGRYVEERREK
jgi:Kae1-associated kinase Bud32